MTSCFVYPDAGGDSPNIVDRPDQPGVSRHHHRDPDAYLIGDKLPDGFKTPFDQAPALAQLGYGEKNDDQKKKLLPSVQIRLRSRDVQGLFYF